MFFEKKVAKLRKDAEETDGNLVRSAAFLRHFDCLL